MINFKCPSCNGILVELHVYNSESKSWSKAYWKDENNFLWFCRNSCGSYSETFLKNKMVNE
jgi:hypothetical protein